jgi:hypothetical protein
MESKKTSAASQSLNTNMITDKLLEFQKRVTAISKDSVNPFFKSKYFDVNTVIDTIKPILNEVGLVVSQPLGTQEGRNVLITRVLDGNQTILDSIVFLPEQPDVQKLGAAITYMRRYALVSLLLLQGGEDDDGNVASKPAPVKAQTNNNSGYLCSEHGSTIGKVPAGVSKKTGKAYDAFLACSVRGCRASITDIDHNEVRKNPETGQMEPIKREVEFAIDGDYPQ